MDPLDKLAANSCQIDENFPTTTGQECHSTRELNKMGCEASDAG